jgi:predicted ABC-type ATPase
MTETAANSYSPPRCYIIAGPNGAGKTTFALKFLPQTAGCERFVNADEIAKGLSPLNPHAALIQATRIFLDTIEQAIEARESFAFETTLSGKTYLNRIRQWRHLGWEVILIYLYVRSPQLSEDRVKERVQQGGHDIPREDINRRFPRSLANLLEYAKVCNRVLCLDNSQAGIKVIFEQTCGAAPRVEDEALYHEILTYSETHV